MQIFEAIPKQWGNSIGITIPKDIVDKEHISAKKKIKFIAIGSLKLKKSTQKAMDEIDEGYD
jgi:antitoxin component of MazEF toxin-antitoxin module